MSELGLEQLPKFLERFVDNKTIIKKNNRFCFGLGLIDQCLKSFNNKILLHQQNRENYLDLSRGNVYFGTGGAAPLILDYENKIYRPSLGKDLLNAARVVDKLDNLSFFSRPLVLTDITDPHPDSPSNSLLSKNALSIYKSILKKGGIFVAQTDNVQIAPTHKDDMLDKLSDCLLYTSPSPRDG